MSRIAPEDLESIRSVIGKNKRFLVVAHVDPDGDCVGSMLAVARFLESSGKEARCYIPGSIPDNYMKLEGMSLLLTDLELADFDYQAVFAVDTATLDRAGNSFDPEGGIDIVNIDHHPTNDHYGTINVVIDDTAAVAVIIYHLISSFSEDFITPEIAGYLYLGVVMDTGCFKFRNTDAESLYVASRLIEKGARADQIAREFYVKKKYRSVKLLSRVLAGMQLFEHGRIAIMRLTCSMLEECGAKTEDTEGFIDFATAIEDVEVAAFLRELSSDKVKVSLRSVDHYDVASFAESFGGGGHTNAAGVIIEADLERSFKIVLKGLRDML